MASTTLTSYKTQITAKAGLDVTADDTLLTSWLTRPTRTSSSAPIARSGPPA